MFCLHCGNEMSDDARFCGICGNLINENAAPRAPVSPPPMPMPAPMPAPMPMPTPATQKLPIGLCIGVVVAIEIVKALNNNFLTSIIGKWIDIYDRNSPYFILSAIKTYLLIPLVTAAIAIGFLVLFNKGRQRRHLPPVSFLFAGAPLLSIFCANKAATLLMWPIREVLYSSDWLYRLFNWISNLVDLVFTICFGVALLCLLCRQLLKYEQQRVISAQTPGATMSGEAFPSYRAAYPLPGGLTLALPAVGALLYLIIPILLNLLRSRIDYTNTWASLAITVFGNYLLLSALLLGSFLLGIKFYNNDCLRKGLPQCKLPFVFIVLPYAIYYVAENLSELVISLINAIVIAIEPNSFDSLGVSISIGIVYLVMMTALTVIFSVVAFKKLVIKVNANRGFFSPNGAVSQPF